MSVQLTIATIDYDHFRDFRLGLVRAEGIEANWLTLGHHEIFSRFTFTREWRSRNYPSPGSPPKSGEKIPTSSACRSMPRGADLILPPQCEGSREVAIRVARTRDIQLERYAAPGLENVRMNARAHRPVLEDVARVDGTGLGLLRDAPDSMHLSARGVNARNFRTI